MTMKILLNTIKKYLAPFLNTTVVIVIIGFVLTACDQGTENALTVANDGTVKESGITAALNEDTGFNGLDENKPRVYGCPMNCIEPMEKSGRCPVCGMDLVAIVRDGHQHRDGPPSITLAAEKIRGAGIRTAPVEQKFVDAEIRLFGKIEYDPVEQYKVTAFAPGVIDRIYVKRAGQTVRAGDPLFDMHSSELFVLEQDLFQELKHFPDPVDYRPAKGQIYKRQMRPPRRQFRIPKEGQAPPEEIEAKNAALKIITQIKRKMLLLGLTHENIERVMARGLPTGISTVTTPTTGVVLEQYAYKGAYVNTGETVFNIASPKYIWAKLDGYASDFPWIRLGQAAELETDAYPGEAFAGNISYLDPEFDPQTRTFKIGVLFKDPQKQLRPNMLVRCVIHSSLAAKGAARTRNRHNENKAPLVIPDSAPLITGNRAVVYVADPVRTGTYEGREVVLGPRATGYYVVTHGLKVGEMVVVNGNFKIDSAVQIQARSSMMTPHKSMNMSTHNKDSHQSVSLSAPMQSGSGKPVATRQNANKVENRRKRFTKLLRSRELKPAGRMRTDSRQRMSQMQHTRTDSMKMPPDSAGGDKSHEHRVDAALPAIQMEHRNGHNEKIHRNMKDK